MNMPSKISQKIKQIRGSVPYIGLWKSLLRFAPYQFNYPSQFYKSNLRGEYLSALCSDIITESMDYEWSSQEISRTIYTFWHQGINKAPNSIQMTADLLKNNSPNDINIVMLDRENMEDYVDLDESIIQKFDSGFLYPAHFSDILRFSVLFQNGGLWIDAGTYFFSGIDEMFTGRMRSLRDDDARISRKYASLGRWSPQVWFGRKSDPFFSIVSRCLARVHLSKYPVEYLIMDELLDLVVQKSSIIGSELERSRKINDFSGLQKCILSGNLSSSPCQDYPVGKLSYKNDTKMPYS